ncbi:protein ASPARTIC PROTEASE IN GUARD CELL 1-like [Cornus florida]|uniref:protein ASPARTIC PROTEASE IN GUARD CELL 1-like n=1 Tax=Cornus florida TaxID=4283 RepID=UPI0028A000E7|nr:protein ASPARTIC PROTEASE IN GUARD CELL 1-like [Cornus florida]
MAAKICILLSFSLSILDSVLCVLGLSRSTQQLPLSAPSLSFPRDSYRMSLPIYPLFTRKTQFKDLDSLLIARLRDDAARVKSIDAIMNMYKTRKVYDIPVSSGYVLYNGDTFQYVTLVGVGQPSQYFYFILDTGSDLNWVYSDLCNVCGHDLFYRNMSSTYKEISCYMEQCQYVRYHTCLYQSCYYALRYGDGASAAGILSLEKLSFGINSFNNLLIGATRRAQDIAVTPGLLGLSRGKLSLVSQLNASSFSYCLVQHSSTASSTLDFNTSILPGSDITALLPHDIFYQVTLTLISVNRQQIPVVSGRYDGKMNIDSGTIVTRLPSRIYYQFRDAFIQTSRGFSNRISYDGFDTCYEFYHVVDPIFPLVWLHFGKTILRLGPANVFVELPLRLSFQPMQLLY